MVFRIRYFLLTFVFASVINTANAQLEELKENRFQIGIASKIQLTTFRAQNESSQSPVPIGYNKGYTPKLGFKFGVPFRISWDKFFVGIGLYYINDNSRSSIEQITFGSSNSTIHADNNFNWFEFPLNFNYIVYKKSRYNFYCGLGGSVRRLLSSSVRISTVTGPLTITGDKINTYDTFNNWNLFGEILVGSNVKIADVHQISIFLIYNRSLNDLTAASTVIDPNFNIVHLKSNLSSYNLGVSYFFK